ncbi:nickel pincer cofactor biosynthesis protein LarC [Peptoniphilus sp.]|jgi:tRNA-Thr(GGU) m(6)t(6)A37 methyltransferase TsaA|uniref:nickel pincer cofactor biosynthesis protein LarC n=1 Tax=Peptoniphilus sp. TaxID=1971214 RepID=UPI003D8F34AB
MRSLYLDCNMGAAGDMLTAALLELFDNKDEMVKKLNRFGIPKVTFSSEEALSSGINGRRSIVKIDGMEEELSDFHEHDEHHHDHEHSHSHEHSHEHDHEHDHSHEHSHEHDDIHEHNHDHDDIHEHNHDHDHDHHHDHEHHHTHSHVHRGMKEITEIVNSLEISPKVREDILEVYNLIAVAESASHNVDVSEIHFHEVGTLDAIADIAAVCFLIDELKVDKIVASRINVGGGHVHCAHGILPVPAPATAYILKGLPIYSGKVLSELTTPTGAALLKYFVDEYGDMPTMNVEKIGYGLGKKEFEVLNAVRVFLGESEDKSDLVYELSCNVDDMTGEDISFTMDRLFEGGAREVYVIPIIMKKSRPGNLIRVMCTEKDKENLVKLIFKHTTTIGIREVETKRYILDREIKKVDTEFGETRVKESSGYGVTRKKFEYDDLAKIADENNLSLEEVRDKIENGPQVEKNKEFSMKPVGYIKSPYLTRDEIPRQSVLSDKSAVIEIEEEFRDGLFNLEIGKYIVILFAFHKSKKNPALIINHKYTDGTKGIFATRSPNRPNPIGLSICKIIDLNDKSITIEGVDMLDGTPVLDIKPYVEWLNPNVESEE